MRIYPLVSLPILAYLAKADSTCENDLEYSLGLKNKNCYSWFRNKEDRRQDICSRKSEAREKCRKTCGLCCGNDAGFKFVIGDNRGTPIKKSCNWLDKGNETKRKEDFCGTGSGGILVKEAW